MDNFTKEENQAYEWAKKQVFTSVAASYARVLAKYISKNLDQEKAGSNAKDERIKVLEASLADVRDNFEKAMAADRADIAKRCEKVAEYMYNKNVAALPEQSRDGLPGWGELRQHPVTQQLVEIYLSEARTIMNLLVGG